MALHPPSSKRERVLAFGESGSGKSSTWMAVADWMERTKATGHLYVLDTDSAWEGYRPEDGSLDEYITVYQLDALTYRDWRPAIQKVRANVKRDDWVVLDMADKAWRVAQNHYWQKKGGDNFSDAFAAAVIDDDMAELSGHHGTNWGAINLFYEDIFYPIINMPCHVLVVAPSKGLQTERKGQGGKAVVKEEDREWERIGSKPKGQGDLKHAFHTILYCAETPSGWTYTTVKERGPINRGKRAYLKGEKVQDFVVSYLFKVAGWRP